MLQHIKLHEPKPHQCLHCKEFFSREFNLQRHIENNHKVSFPNGGTFVSEERVKAQCNIKCPHCVKKYSSKQSLNHHIENYHRATQTGKGVINFGKTMFGIFENSEVESLFNDDHNEEEDTPYRS